MRMQANQIECLEKKVLSSLCLIACDGLAIFYCSKKSIFSNYEEMYEFASIELFVLSDSSLSTTLGLFIIEAYLKQ